jgi:hypothetical protein
MLKNVSKPLLVFLLSLFGFQYMEGQILLDEEPTRLYYNRTARVKNPKDWKNFRDVFHYDHFLLGKNRISGNISYNWQRVLIDDGRRIHTNYRHAIGIFTRIRFFEEFSFNTNFQIPLNSVANVRWISDFTYSVGRYNWRAKRFNFGYENYINNKYSDSWRTIGNKFLEGYYFVSYNLFSEKLDRAVTFDSSGSLRFTFFSRYAINYRDEFDITHGGILDGKPTFGAAFRYTFFRNIYVESAVYFYVSPAKKQPWDPDYSYGFGYFNWRSFRISLTYGNWAVNRFPWNSKYYPKYGFLDGNFRFIVNYIW